VDSPTYTVGVFQDVRWAERGIQALLADGFAPGALSILVRHSPEAAALIRGTLRVEPQQREIKGLETVLAAGPDAALETAGMPTAFARAGFQSHDGYIFQTLVGRGGVLVGVQSEARASDALARLHAYGAGNAAIGAWTGRL
jgi:hypothetical protein